MRKNHKKKNGLLWKVLSLVFAICLWYFVIQVQNPNDIYVASHVDINIINEEELMKNGLCLYDIDNENLSVRLSGKKVLLGKSRNYENEIKGVVDLMDYFTNKKLVQDDGEYLPVKITLPDTLINLAKIDKQSINYIKVYVDEKVETQRDVDIHFESSLGNEYYLDTNKKKVMPQKVEVYGAKTIVESVETLKASVNVSSEKDETYNAKVFAYDKEENIIKNINISPENIQVNIPVLLQKNVKLNINVLNNLSEDTNLEEVKISPAELTIAGTKEVIDKLEGTLSIPITISEEKGEHVISQTINLNEGLYNVKNIDAIDVTYKIKK